MSEQFSAIVLAGGRSSRMGRPKADLKFGSSTLLERIVNELLPAFQHIVVVAAPFGLRGAFAGLSNVSIIRDEHEYEGPLPAVAYGLRTIQSDASFVCSCDLPLLSVELARSLCVRLGEYDAVIPEVGGLVQPLLAAYRKRCATAIDAMLARGENRMTKIVESVSALRLREAELRLVDPELRSFLNVNTPQDYQRVLGLISKSP